MGSTVGEGGDAQITLDPNAAGHGWYIDPTPPHSTTPTTTSPPATPTSGKMDLLSVLLHEYGHALGLEHSSESGDFMAATLQPGQRRLPDDEELQLMSELVAQLKGGSTGDQAPANPVVPSPPLGRRPEEASASSQALFAAHPTLQGGSLQNLQDWAAQGQVAVAGGGAGTGGATLQEGTASQTRLNQVFMVGPNDRYLSFTLSNVALDDQAAGPDDAPRCWRASAPHGPSPPSGWPGSPCRRRRVASCRFLFKDSLTECPGWRPR